MEDKIQNYLKQVKARHPQLKKTVLEKMEKAPTKGRAKAILKEELQNEKRK